MIEIDGERSSNSNRELDGESELEELVATSRREARITNRENRREMVIAELVSRLKEDVSQMLMQVMREKFRHIIRSEMREAIREVCLQKEKADKVVDKEAGEQKEIREGVKNRKDVI